MSHLAATGCALRIPYSTETSWPHKDVAEVRVFVDSQLDATQYVEIARLEAERLRSTPREPPLFLVRFVFLEPGQGEGETGARVDVTRWQTIAELELPANEVPADAGDEPVERTTAAKTAYFAASRGAETP